MKIGVVVFPGSNCDRDTFYAVEQLTGNKAVQIWHQDKAVSSDLDMVILPGGFSYGDYLRAGAIARFSYIMDSVKEFADKGKPVLGICNGFQVLTESHLLPGTLTRNENLRFVCSDVFLKVENEDTMYTSNLKKGQCIQIPIAHGEGNYYIEQEGLLDLEKNNQVVFRYCDKDGNISKESNPNGSVANIAGIINKKGNVLGMMPHPERAIEDILGSSDGKEILNSAFNKLKEI